MIIKAFSSIFDRFHCSFNYAFFQRVYGVYVLVLTICKLQDTMFHHQNIRYVFHKVSLMILKMLQQLAYCYVLKCERQESYGELVLWQPKAMHHCLRSELLFHLL